MVGDDLDLGERRYAIAVGSTSAEAAIAQGVDPANLVAALVGVAEASIARAEERGRHDAGRAAELRERLEARLTELVEGLREDRGRGVFAADHGVDRETLVDGFVDSVRGRVEARGDKSPGEAPDRRG